MERQNLGPYRLERLLGRSGRSSVSPRPESPHAGERRAELLHAHRLPSEWNSSFSAPVAVSVSAEQVRHDVCRFVHRDTGARIDEVRKLRFAGLGDELRPKPCTPLRARSDQCIEVELRQHFADDPTERTRLEFIELEQRCRSRPARAEGMPTRR